MKKTCPEFKDESFITKVVFTEIVDLNKSVYDKECIENKLKCTLRKTNSLNRKFVINEKVLQERMKN